VKKKIDSQSVSETLMQALSDYLTRRVGLHFAKKSWKDLLSKVNGAMTDFGFDRIDEFISWLLSSSPSQHQIEILASHLTVGETYFFRERKAFEILEQFLLPNLITSRRETEKRIRFWSAGCSTGEEAYSLAILLDKVIPDLKDWKVTILATDINTGAIRKGEEAIYSNWSFRDTPQWFKDRYFEKVDVSHHRLRFSIREMVTFSYLNLSEDLYPALQNNTNAMDFIFCRNVLMYFSPEQTKLTVERFHRSLINGGCLIVSPIETTLLTDSPFVMVRSNDSIYYKKDIYKTKTSSKDVKRIEESEGTLPLISPTHVKRRRAEKPSRSTGPHVLIQPEKREQSPYEEAASLYENGFYLEAEEKLRNSFSMGNGKQQSRVLFAKVLANQGKLDEACDFCEEVLSSDKSNAYMHYLLATILEEQQRSDEARISLKKALYLDRNFILAHFALANLALRSGKTIEARKHFDNVMEILSIYKPDDIIPESEGITAGRLAEIIGTSGAQEIA